MTNKLPVPDELLHLIEKREHEARRQRERREAAAAERQLAAERRKAERRELPRRTEDGQAAAPASNGPIRDAAKATDEGLDQEEGRPVE